MRTFLAPALRCLAALSRAVKRAAALEHEVDLQVLPRQVAGPRSASTLRPLPFTVRELAVGDGGVDAAVDRVVLQ
jgi:hypothetical protein